MLTTIRTGADEQPAADRRALILLALCLGVLVAQVNTSVVNLAMHSIGATFARMWPPCNGCWTATI